ncbi:unnamed protein product, partial [Brachionus calyciflorus]
MCVYGAKSSQYTDLIGYFVLNLTQNENVHNDYMGKLVRQLLNYDERDPFLCNSCGFCKFAKFDINL